ncbi:MAG TPA: MdtA/MuxA family multidrug efflux RND transporter periplasmic adaptor subunit [Burkholderiaceae bacterium]|nr:MdtA/MuxA family multidrug efflux RND transporter periplasmic adaptor subunit [Burkholderiaceae bacterium]
MHEAPGPLAGQPSTGQRLLRRLAWIALLVVLVGGGAWGWYRHRAAASADAPPAAAASRSGAGARGAAGPTPVAVAKVANGNVRVTLNALGTVTPMATITVQSQIAGQLVQIGFREGQRVRKGDFLAQIDSRPYQAALDQAQGQLAKDEALLKQAQVDLARYQKLLERNSIARQQAEDQEWIVHQDEGLVKVDQALVATAQLNLNYCRIIAPADGRIGLRLVDQGNFVQAGAGGTGIAVITQTQPINVVFVLPEDNLPQVLKRMRDGAQLPVVAYDRSGTQLLGTGALAAVDSQINTSTGTVNLKAQFANADESLFPNQFVNATLIVDELRGATVMPTAAIQRGAPGTFVYLVGADDAVSLKTVKLGPVDGDRVAVIDGLQPGDRVVVDGADKLRDGAKVAVRDGSAATAAAAPAAATAAAASKDGTGQKPRRRKEGATADANP